MTITDLDGDTLRIKEVYGFGEVMHTIRVTQEGAKGFDPPGEATVALTLPQLKELHAELSRILAKSPNPEV